jgi:hypothetical protein
MREHMKDESTGSCMPGMKASVCPGRTRKPAAHRSSGPVAGLVRPRRLAVLDLLPEEESGRAELAAEPAASLKR